MMIRELVHAKKFEEQFERVTVAMQQIGDAFAVLNDKISNLALTGHEIETDKEKEMIDRLQKMKDELEASVKLERQMYFSALEDLKENKERIDPANIARIENRIKWMEGQVAGIKKDFYEAIGKNKQYVINLCSQDEDHDFSSPDPAIKLS